MNKMKTLAITAAALTVAGVASAQTTVKITGSTAFRKATYNAIVGILDNPRGAAQGISGTTADISGAGRAVITGTIKAGKPGAGQTVVFQTAFGGSVGGLEMVTKALTTVPGVSFGATSTWLSASNTLGNLTVSGSGSITGAPAGTTFDGASAPDVSMSDTLQSSTPWKTPVLGEENAVAGGVGVIDFYWVKGLNHPDIPVASYSAFTNITNLQARLLLANGALPLSIFTGIASDVDYEVAFVGRNDDSGTRVATHAESGYGFGQGQVSYAPNTTSGTITTTVFDAVGQSSGGTVAAALNRALGSGSTSDNGVPWIFVGAVGKSDAHTATGVASGVNLYTSAQTLTWNGQKNDETTNAAIIEGAYTFWTAQHCYYRPTLTGTAKLAVDAMSAQIRDVSATFSGIKISNMKVSRSLEGGVVSP